MQEAHSCDMIWKHRSDVHILSLLGKCPNSLRTSGAISPKIVGIQFSRFPSLVTLSSCTCLLPAVHRSLKQVVAGRFCHGFSYSRPFGPKKKFGTGQFLCVGAANIQYSECFNIQKLWISQLWILSRVQSNASVTSFQVAKAGFFASKLKTLEDPKVGKHLVTTEAVSRPEQGSMESFSGSNRIAGLHQIER